MAETRMIELVLLAFLIYVYLALRKERKRVRILSHFISGLAYLSVDTICCMASDEDKEAAARLAPKYESQFVGNIAKHGVLWDAYFKSSILEGICRILESDYDFPVDKFVKRDRTLFPHWHLYSELHKFVSDRWQQPSGSGKRDAGTS